MSFLESGALPEVEVDEAIARVRDGAFLLDVREPDEWATIHAVGATHIPMGEVVERVRELPDGPVLVICHSGGRSARVTAYLVREGIDAINVAGGTLAWNAAGGETESPAEGSAH